MKALVTGANGFIGRALCDSLVSRGIDVTRVDQRAGAVNAVIVDVSRPDALSRMVDSDTIVFHLAASADVAASVKDPRFDFRHTLGSAFEILETARETGASVVFPSTASVCGHTNTLPLVEDAFTRPVSPYAAGKAAIEAYASAYNAAYGLDVKVVRLFSVYGPTMRRFAIHDIIRKIEANPERIEILGDGTQVRDYLHVADAVRGLQIVAERGVPGETYNIASGQPVKLMDLARTIADLMGHPDTRIDASGQSFPGDTPKWYADTSKASAIGFRPEIKLRDGLAETIRALTGIESPAVTAAR